MHEHNVNTWNQTSHIRKTDKIMHHVNDKIIMLTSLITTNHNNRSLSYVSFIRRGRIGVRFGIRVSGWGVGVAGDLV